MAQALHMKKQNVLICDQKRLTKISGWKATMKSTIEIMMTSAEAMPLATSPGKVFNVKGGACGVTSQLTTKTSKESMPMAIWTDWPRV